MKVDKRWFLQTIWITVLVLLVNSVHGDDEGKKQPNKAEDEYFELMQLFADTFEQVERNYVKEVDRRRLMEAALRGMLLELDPYSTYISPEELSQFNQRVEQEFGGVGIQVQIDPGTRRILVISPLPDTPAYNAGVRAGDLLMEIEGEDTENMPLTRAVELMKGPAGEDVAVKVRHMGGAEDDLKITRAIIQVKSVLGDFYKSDGQWEFMLDAENKIGYVRLTQFGRQSADELAQVLTQLQDRGMKGLVLDLRFNPGGLLSQAISIADLFIESGTIVSTEGRNSEPRKWEASEPGTFSEFPMAILVNRFSASASEIVSACLQDHKRATVVGERTFGKGLVQNVVDIDQGRSAIKLTTAGYLRPSGANIDRYTAKDNQEWGVTPNEGFGIRMSREELAEYSQVRRDRDILKGEAPAESEFEDKQLNKALEHLKSVLSEKPAAEDKKDDSNAEKKEEEKKAA
ncbi:MAG: S41 family peptidase [Planctomycetota bacterium]|jgi:carboxyl-terminal processing protease